MSEDISSDGEEMFADAVDNECDSVVVPEENTRPSSPLFTTVDVDDEEEDGECVVVPIAKTIPPSPPFLNIRVNDDVWNKHLQDCGCEEKDLPAKRYKKAKILSVGPKGGDQTFYFNLPALAVDYVKKMLTQHKNGVAWFKLPK